MRALAMAESPRPPMHKRRRPFPMGPLSASPWLQGTNLFPFDGAVIFDPTQRPWKALRVAQGQNFVLGEFTAALRKT